MREKRYQRTWLILGVITLTLCLSTSSYAQSVKRQCISSYGSSALTDKIMVQQTVGQGFATQSSVENSSTLQGFQQPVKLSVEVVNDFTGFTLDLYVFPNPASQAVTIQSNENLEKAHIVASDVNGRIYFSDTVLDLNTHTINCEKWSNGVYFIKIYDEQGNHKSLKIIISK